jgi:hypothetical protein
MLINTYLRCDTAISTGSGHFQHHHHSFSTRSNFCWLTFWHHILIIYTLCFDGLCSLIHYIPPCVVCWHIILIQYWYGIMNKLWPWWTGVWILVGARFCSSSKHSDQLWGEPTSYSMCTGFFPGKKAARWWSIPLTSIYFWGYEWLELYLYFPSVPVCVNSCWDILKQNKTTVYAKMPQQLRLFMKNMLDIHYKNTVVWLEHHEGSGSILGWTIWELWWMKWQEN